jgi:hypothetical protein
MPADGFGRYLPQVRIHKKPTQGADAKLCTSTFPWGSPKAETYQNMDLVIKILSTAIKDYTKFRNLSNEIEPTSFSSSINRGLWNESNPNATVPLTPDAMIVTRCQDILYFPELYGFLNFNVYPLIISRSASYILVTGEPANHKHPNNPICEKILTSLVDFLGDHFPKSTVVLRRGYPGR